MPNCHFTCTLYKLAAVLLASSLQCTQRKIILSLSNHEESHPFQLRLRLSRAVDLVFLISRFKTSCKQWAKAVSKIIAHASFAFMWSSAVIFSDF